MTTTTYEKMICPGCDVIVYASQGTCDCCGTELNNQHATADLLRAILNEIDGAITVIDKWRPNPELDHIGYTISGANISGLTHACMIIARHAHAAGIEL